MSAIFQLNISPCNGLVAHKHMHERARDLPPKRIKRKYKSLIIPSVESKSIAEVQRPPKVPLQQRLVAERKEVGNGKESNNKVTQTANFTPSGQITRRFSVAEKLRIIEKHKELKNVSATSR